MRLRVGYDIRFTLPAPAHVLMALRVHPTVEPNLARPETPVVEPALALGEFLDGFGNQMMRVEAPAGSLRISNDAEVDVDGLPDPVEPWAVQHPVADLPPEVLPYLLSSRYCEVDHLTQNAWDLFGGIEPGWSRVQAICDWVHDRIEFGNHHARSTRSAREGIDDGRGVCRDFAHLAITLCRCMNIPARYATGYLGDIGIPISTAPMDFSAWFEAYLGGRWYTFDARHNIPRIGRVVMARGRDAVDVALTTSFGPMWLDDFNVWTYEVTPVTA